MTNFYLTPLIEIVNADETLTNEISITVGADAAIQLDFNIPTVAQGVRIYRSQSSNTEVLLVEIPFGDTIRKKDVISLPMSFIDSGSLTPGGNGYPQFSNLTPDEQKAVPVPSFSLSELASEGTLPAGMYYYRVSFYTQIDLGITYQDAEINPRLFEADITHALVSSPESISHSDFTEVTDIFSYLDTQVGEITTSQELVNGTLVSAQELVWNSSVIKKIISDRVGVTVFTEFSTAVAGVPVNLLVYPTNESAEVHENALTGPSIVLSGVTSKVFDEAGSVTLFLSERASLLYAMSPVSFTVVA